jgi:hypothetical protein
LRSVNPRARWRPPPEPTTRLAELRSDSSPFPD